MPIRWGRVSRAVLVVCGVAAAGWVGLNFGFFSDPRVDVTSGPNGCRVAACVYTRSLLDIVFSRSWSCVACFAPGHLECGETDEVKGVRVTCHCSGAVDGGAG